MLVIDYAHSRVKWNRVAYTSLRHRDEKKWRERRVVLKLDREIKGRDIRRAILQKAPPISIPYLCDPAVIRLLAANDECTLRCNFLCNDQKSNAICSSSEIENEAENEAYL